MTVGRGPFREGAFAVPRWTPPSRPTRYPPLTCSQLLLAIASTDVSLHFIFPHNFFPRPHSIPLMMRNSPFSFVLHFPSSRNPWPLFLHSSPSPASLPFPFCQPWSPPPLSLPRPSPLYYPRPPYLIIPTQIPVYPPSPLSLPPLQCLVSHSQLSSASVNQRWTWGHMLNDVKGWRETGHEFGNPSFWKVMLDLSTLIGEILRHVVVVFAFETGAI